MREAKESDLQQRCDSQSRKVLEQMRSRLQRDNLKVVFDDRAVEVLLKYAWSPKDVAKELAYLNSLKDENGIPFARSIKQYSAMEIVWNQFTLPSVGSFTWNRNFKAGCSKVAERYSKAHLECLKYHSNSDILDAVSDWSTSSGFTAIVEPGASHKCDVADENLYDRWRNKANAAINDGSFNSFMVPGIRTQASGEYNDDGSRTYACKHKTRPIWMVDVWQVISGRMWAKPLTNWISSYKFSGVGKSDMDISGRIFAMKKRNSKWLSLDYSMYDSTLPAWLIEQAFEIISLAFPGMTPWEEKLLRILKNDFIYKNLITADGVLYCEHGDPSGDALTTIVNGICNEIITETWLARFNQTAEYMIVGDDNLILYSGEIILEEVASYILRNFGITVNAVKSAYGDLDSSSPEFLSRYWTDWGPWRHPHILISKIAFPERHRCYSENGSSPELTIYSYILGYEPAMRELMDVSSFLIDTGLAITKFHLSDSGFKNLPYNVQTNIMVLEGKA